MKPNLMHKLARNGCHDSDAPKAWHSVPNLTGDYDMDATILHRSNKDMPKRLELYLKKPKGSYGPKTAYDGYGRGDD